MSMTTHNIFGTPVATKDGSTPDGNTKGKVVKTTDESYVGKETGCFSGAEDTISTSTATPRQ